MSNLINEIIKNKQIVVLKGQDATSSIKSIEIINGCYEVTFKNGKAFKYKKNNVQICNYIRTIIKDDNFSVLVDGTFMNDVKALHKYDGYDRVEFNDGKSMVYEQNRISMTNGCEQRNNGDATLNYFKEISKYIRVPDEDLTDKSYLCDKYSRLKYVPKSSLLSRYLNENIPVGKLNRVKKVIYPFETNLSQINAINCALTNDISFIQGPPGTGKTQTIINLIANLLVNEKTIAVVSNNNAAVANVYEKLNKVGLGFLCANLGNSGNIENFIKNQTGKYPPDIEKWKFESYDYKTLEKDIINVSRELTMCFAIQNKIASLNSMRNDYQLEYEHYKLHCQRSISNADMIQFSSKKILKMKMILENYNEKGKWPNFLVKLAYSLIYGTYIFGVFSSNYGRANDLINVSYYERTIEEIDSELLKLKKNITGMEGVTSKLKELSIIYLKKQLYAKYGGRATRKTFTKADLNFNSKSFMKEYPIILSTTFSISTSLGNNELFDYLIVDEASQVDLVTGALAMSCAKNGVIVGDVNQLPNIISNELSTIVTDIASRYRISSVYNYLQHSLLESCLLRWKDGPNTLLREHYRCHPKIAKFFNEEFYNGQLIVIREDKGEDVLFPIRTNEGNHARGRVNIRQIDEMNIQVIPRLKELGYSDVGIITPYRDQVKTITERLKSSDENYEVSTVHKFQGREKEAIVLLTVDNEISDFTDNPNLLNVAVSRAKDYLVVIMSNNEKNNATYYGELFRYCEYCNVKIREGVVSSIFDLLYKINESERIKYLRNVTKHSDYDSENLLRSVIDKVLEEQFPKYGVIQNYKLIDLFHDFSCFNEGELQYIRNGAHVDYLIYDKLDKTPILCIELDGTSFHKTNSPQYDRDLMKNGIFENNRVSISLKRIRTDESGEREKIIQWLHEKEGV